MPYGQAEYAGVNEIVRLESLCSTSDTIEVQLRSNVHDALWMLSRQYDIGEFKGENAGSALKTLVSKTNKRINRFKIDGIDPVEINNVEILEPKVEKTPWKIDILSRIKLGKFWNKLLKNKIISQDSLFDLYGSDISDEFLFDETSLDDFESEILASNKDLLNLSNLISGKLVDGWQLYNVLKANNTLHGYNAITITDHLSSFQEIESKFIQWVENRYKCTGQTNEERSWNPESLEYSFECSAQEDTNTSSSDQVVLTAKEYQAGRLDWYSFNLGPENSNHGNNREEYTEPASKIIVTKTEEFLPSKLSFKGALSSRWWEFDDAIIDINNIRTRKNDITRILTIHHLQAFTHDWQIIPISIPVGSITDIESIEIIDSFGDNYVIESMSDPANCNFFTLNQKGSLYALDMESRLVIPPVVAKRIESKPIEEVMFVRDEMANMVWAIEKIVPDLFNGGFNGKELSSLIEKYYDEILNPVEEIDNEQVRSNASKAYKLASTTPEHWIPMLPVKRNIANYRDFQFQRATSYRIVKDVNTRERIRPKTNILLADGEKLPEQNEQYFINEEEILRHGIIVQSKYQRARDYDGSVKTWLGREKHSGKSEYGDYRTDVVLPFDDPATLISNDKWLRKSDLPVELYNAGIFSINEKIYVVRGTSNAGQLSTFYEYDTINDIWVEKTGWSNAYNCHGCSINGIGYVIGGREDGQSWNFLSLSAYDPVNGEWIGKGDLMAGGNTIDMRINGVIAALNDKIYFGLGEFSNGEIKQDWYEIQATGSTVSCSILPVPLTPISRASYFTINNKLYVIGGLTNEGASYKNYCFDPSDNSWTEMTELPDNRGGISLCGGFSLNGYGYVCCGEHGDGLSSISVWQYDPENNAWARKENFPGSNKKIQGLTSEANSKAYIIGGQNSNGDILDDMWEYEF